MFIIQSFEHKKIIFVTDSTKDSKASSAAKKSETKVEKVESEEEDVKDKDKKKKGKEKGKGKKNEEGESINEVSALLRSVYAGGPFTTNFCRYHMILNDVNLKIGQHHAP